VTLKESVPLYPPPVLSRDFKVFDRNTLSVIRVPAALIGVKKSIMMVFNHNQSLQLSMDTDGEGIYASATVSNTRDQETDQGLTLSPKIHSIDAWQLEANGGLSNEEFEAILGPMELELTENNAQQDDSWAYEMFNDDFQAPEPPRKRIRLSREPTKEPVVEPKLSESTSNEAMVSSSNTIDDVTKRLQPLPTVDQMPQPSIGSIPAPLRHLEDENGLSTSNSQLQDSLPRANSESVDPLQNTAVSPVGGVDEPVRPLHYFTVIANTNQRSKSTPTYQSPYKANTLPSPTNLNNAILPRPATFGQTNEPPSESQQGRSSSQQRGQIIISTSFPGPSQPLECIDLDGDNDSLFGDDEPGIDIDASSTSGRSLWSADIGTQSTRSSTPRTATWDPDIPLSSVESNLSHGDAERLRRTITQSCRIPRLSKKATAEYAVRHGFFDVAHDPETTSVTSPSLVTTTREISTLRKPHHRPQPATSEQPVFQRILQELRSRLASSTTKPHTVPPDLTRLFESLENKFNQDSNFRNSVLTWAIGKVESMRKFSHLLDRTLLTTFPAEIKETPSKEGLARRHLERAMEKIRKVEEENSDLKHQLQQMSQYIGYLESVNRSVPRYL